MNSDFATKQEIRELLQETKNLDRAIKDAVSQIKSSIRDSEHQRSMDFWWAFFFVSMICSAAIIALSLR